MNFLSIITFNPIVVRGWLLLSILYLLLACQPEKGTQATAVPSNTPLPSTAIVSTPTEIVAPPPTSTKISATSTPTSTPLPLATLHATTSWLFWENLEYVNTNSNVPTGYYLSNSDGSALTQLENINPSEAITFFITEPVPAQTILHGQYLVTVQYVPTDTVRSIWHKPTNLSLWELPTARLIAETPLLSEAANITLTNNQSLPALFAIRNMAWSPDAHYLAFAAALDDATSDIYLLDTQDGTIHRAIDGPLEAFPIEWSPDGDWFLYGSAETLYVECECPEEIWLYNLADNSARHLYDTSAFRESVLGWLDGEWVITVSNAFEGNDSNPRKINLFTGEVVLLDEGSFGVDAYSPNGFLILNRTPTMWTPDGLDTTLFTAIDVRTNTRTEFHIPSDGSQLVWMGEPMGLFATHDRINRYLFDHTGAIQYTFPYGDFHGHPQLSPNRQWILVDTPDGWDIYYTDGTLLADLNLPGRPLWVPDNQILVMEERGWSLYRPSSLEFTSQASKWERTTLMEDIQEMDWVWLVHDLP